MPTYEYACETCKHKYQEWHRMSDPHPDECPKCGSPYGDGFGQVYTGGAAGWVYGNPTTFGQQAEINAKRVGKEGMERMVEQERAIRRGWHGPKHE